MSKNPGQLQDARADLLGRGFLGFGQQTITDIARGSQTVLSMDLSVRDGTIYPYAGRPQTRIETLTDSTAPSPYTRVTGTISSFEVRRPASAPGTFFIAPAGTDVTVDETRNGTTQTLRSDDITQVWDDYGNETSRTVATVGGSVVVADTVFAHTSPIDGGQFIAEWLIGVPRENVVRSTENGVSRTRVTQFVHDLQGNMTDVIVEPAGDPSLRRATHFEYQQGLVTSVSVVGSGETRDVSLSYDSDLVFPRRFVDALGHVHTVYFDSALGVQLADIDANGESSWSQYDGFGRGRAQLNEGGETVTRQYVSTANAELEVRTQRAGGGQSVEFYDERGAKTGSASTMFDGRWTSIRRDYDRLGNEVFVSRPLVLASAPGGPTGAPVGVTTTFDRLNRPTRILGPDGAVVDWTYDGRRSTMSDEIGHPVVSEVDPNGRISKRSETLAGLGTRETTFVYGPFNVISQINHTHQPGQTFEHDALGRRTRIVDPDAGTRTFTYNAFGDVVGEADATGSSVTYQLDKLGRITKRTDVRGDTLYAWDSALYGAGELAATRSSDGVLTRVSYDPFGRIAARATTTSAGDFTSTYQYDQLGRLSVESFPVTGAPFTVSTRYNTHGYLDQISSGASALFTIQSRNEDGALTSMMFGNGAVGDTQYDAATGLMTLKRVTSAAVAIWEETYSYNGRHLLEYRNENISGRQEAFGYDEARRMNRHFIGTHIINYTYDIRGNVRRVSDGQTYADNFRHSETQTHQLVNALYTQGGQGRYGEVTYDANGRLTTDRKDWTNAGSQYNHERVLTYTTFDLPRTITSTLTRDGIAVSAHDVQLKYDAFGTRVETTEQGVTRRTYVGGSYERVENDPSDGATRQYVFIPGPDGIAAQVTFDDLGGQTDLKYFHSDMLGSIRIHTDANGAIALQREYEPYGAEVDRNLERVDLFIELANGSSPRRAEPGFTGHRHDSSLGLVNMKGRIYDPILRRFLTPDPVSVHATHEYSLRRGMTSSNAEDWLDSTFDPLHAGDGLADRPIATLLNQLHASQGQTAHAGVASGSSDGISFAPPAVDGSQSSAGSHSRTPGAPAAAGPGFTATVGSSWEVYNPYSYANNSPTSFVDPDGYNPILVAVGVLVVLGSNLASDDAERNRQAHPEVTAFNDQHPVLGAILSLADVAIVAGPGKAAGAAIKASAERAVAESVATRRAAAVHGGASTGGGGGRPKLQPYGGPGGGHHVPAKNAFEGAKNYDLKKALAVPNSEMKRLGVNHGLVTGSQKSQYMAFAKTGRPLTWDVVRQIETQALIRGGMKPAAARTTVDTAIDALQQSGVKGPTQIPWGG